ncbi:MFS transporter [Pseudonocardia spinosispora]|uniref:MFS transporter n=1 Tax=Pseudonocardia spinosispora TaxID=103441 RepID=UPI0004179583|nr:MFS transporter [Pseudonocardia spinosispora]
MRAEPPTPDIRRVIAVSVTILFVAWIVDYVDRLVIATALPTIGTEFGLNHTQQGLLLTAFFVTYALFQIPGGMLADRIGSRKTMVIAMTAWSAFTGLSGLATSLGMLLIVRVLFGASEGIFPGAAMKATNERTTPRNRMTAGGVILSANTLGAALAPLIAAPLITAIGWRHAFFSIAVAGVAVAALLWFALPRALSSRLTRDVPVTGRGLSVFAMLGKGVLWRFALIYGGYNLVFWGMAAWVPGYLQTERHLSLNASGLLASIPPACGVVGSVLGGLLFDRVFPHRHRLLIVPPCVVSGIFLLLMARAASTEMFIIYQALTMLVYSLPSQPIFGLPLRLLPAEVVGSASAMINMGGQISGAIAPIAMGILADEVSFTAAFLFLELGLATAVIAAYWAPQRPADLISHFPELFDRPATTTL